VVGDHLDRDVLLLVRVVALARDALDVPDDRLEEVDVVVARLALDHRHDALEAHAGVDVLRRQLGAAPDASRLFWMKTRFQISR
jgi:hypothetical protein